MKIFKDIEVKSEIDEFTLKEFNQLVTIMERDDLQIFSKYTEMMELLGIPEDVALSCTIDELYDFGSIMGGVDYNKYELQEQIEIDGRIYKLVPFNVRVGKLMEKYSKEFADELPIFIAAIRYQDESLTQNEHNDKAHIRHKMNLFSNEIATPYVVAYTNTMKAFSDIDEE